MTIICRTYLPSGLVGAMMNPSNPSSIMNPSNPSSFMNYQSTPANYVPGLNAFVAIYKVEAYNILIIYFCEF